MKAFIFRNERTRRDLERQLRPVLGPDWKFFTLRQQFAGYRFEAVVIHDWHEISRTEPNALLTQMIETLRLRLNVGCSGNIVYL